MKKISYFFGAICISGFLLFSCNTQNRQAGSENPGISKDSLEIACGKLQGYIDEGKLAGISAMVVKDNQTVLKRNFGLADIENQKPIEDNTIFRIYSMTKPITAVALMTLYDEGKFELDDEVSKFIPEFENTPVYNPETKELESQVNKMTIRHLLTHTSGLTYGWDQKAYVDSLYRATGASGWDATLGEKVRILAGIPLKYQPGTTWEYGVSIDVAGYICEVLSGMPLDEFFKTRIFDPLKMDDSGFYVPESKQSRFAVLYNKGENGELKGSDNPDDNFKRKPVLFSGGGGGVSTIDDYSRFGRMLINGGELDGVRVLQESTVKMIMSNQLPEGVDYNNGGQYGLGGSVDSKTGRYGWSGAASTHFVADPENKMVILALTQLMPFDISYATQFVDDVENAIEK
ncbi:serine hydrolase domain-containing protein [Maribellus sp. YY47]|uniref:serine hydrolase domain-containing protein n=1 Tax=Maribellus sp. YY47 TaxID=2929486 RepID=UPI0020006F64|nr:serine hydrolase domain-containing protein [Maribellus sp. YY47]MCK3685263.1 beta-lactamase family protein [Maribellus sp. YY47]